MLLEGHLLVPPLHCAKDNCPPGVPDTLSPPLLLGHRVSRTLEFPIYMASSCCCVGIFLGSVLPRLARAVGELPWGGGVMDRVWPQSLSCPHRTRNSRAWCGPGVRRTWAPIRSLHLSFHLTAPQMSGDRPASGLMVFPAML